MTNVRAKTFVRFCVSSLIQLEAPLLSACRRPQGCCILLRFQERDLEAAERYQFRAWDRVPYVILSDEHEDDYDRELDRVAASAFGLATTRQPGQVLVVVNNKYAQFIGSAWVLRQKKKNNKKKNKKKKKTLQSITLKCAHCARVLKRALVCQPCQDAFYCSKVCQISDWSVHKLRCFRRRFLPRQCLSQSEEDELRLINSVPSGILDTMMEILIEAMIQQTTNEVSVLVYPSASGLHQILECIKNADLSADDLFRPVFLDPLREALLDCHTMTIAQFNRLSDIKLESGSRHACVAVAFRLGAVILARGNN